jgi:hypothetical protein
MVSCRAVTEGHLHFLDAPGSPAVHAADIDEPDPVALGNGFENFSGNGQTPSAASSRNQKQLLRSAQDDMSF